MTGEQLELDLDRAALDQAAEEVTALVALSYLREVAGRPLTREQRDQQARAEQLARYWTRQERKERRP